MPITITSMLDAVKVSKIDPLAPGSMFKNPAGSQLANLSSIPTKLNAIPGLNTTSMTNKIGAYSSAVNMNTANRLTGLVGHLPMANGYQSTLNLIAMRDGNSILTGCGFLNAAFRSLTDIGVIINQVLSDINDMINNAINGAFDFINMTVDQISEWIANATVEVVEAISAALSSIFNAIDDLLDGALTDFTNMISAEAELIDKMLEDMINHSFLKSISISRPCANALMNTVIDASVINLSLLR